MGLKICSLSSGSTGNSIFVSSEKTKLLIDIGVPVERIEKSLKILKTDCSDVSVLTTHNHSDHISSVNAFIKKYGGCAYAHYLSFDTFRKRGSYNSSTINEFGYEDFTIGDLMISPFKVSHDVPCIGYCISDQNKKISILTDLGFIDDSIINKIKDSDIVLMEANHDEDLVAENYNYPYHLRRRILSSSGHLSNKDCADAVVKLANSGVKQIILAHLSRENNYPELAYNTVSAKLLENGIKEGKDILVEVAEAEAMSGLYEIC